MTQEAAQLIVIECSEGTAARLRNELGSLAESQYRISERKNLDGSEATWIVVASLALQALPIVLNFIETNFIQSRHISRIKVGDIEIDKPTEEDMQRLRKLYDKAAKSGKKDG